LAILLHGVLGVGKTSTAETIAHQWRKPLLPITYDDLGLLPSQVESKLKTSFGLLSSGVVFFCWTARMSSSRKKRH
jgi:hypothetical protein